MVGSQGRDLKQEPGGRSWAKNVNECLWLAWPPWLLSLLSHKTHTISSKALMPTVGLALISNINKEKSQRCINIKIMDVFSQLKFSFPSLLECIKVDEKRTTKAPLCLLVFNYEIKIWSLSLVYNSQAHLHLLLRLNMF